MEVNPKFRQVLEACTRLKKKLVGRFIKKSEISKKTELNLKSLRILGISFIFIFVGVVMIMPSEAPVEFTEKIVKEPDHQEQGSSDESTAPSKSVRSVWDSQRPPLPSGASGGAQVNYDTSMILGAKNGNAKTQLRAGVRLPLRIVDKFIVSQDPVPILAELLLNARTDSGLTLPAGTRFYGEASFQKGAERATIQFRQISLPDGQIHPFHGIAVGKDGQPGVPGRVYSDGLKNTAGSLLTTFLSGFAAGSVETDFMGRSRGGVGNGLLTAVAETSKEKAQAYGDKMKQEREWVEVSSNAECDVLLNDSMNLQQGVTD